MKRLVIALVGVALVVPAGADTLWDTGAPHQVNFNGSETYLGFSSGNLGAGSEQRWIAAPFRIGGGGAIVTQIDADWFVVGGGGADNVNYIIWNRTGLAAPVNGDQVSSGVLGAYGPGIDDPRIAATEDWLHQYTGLAINLAAGDYYLSIYGDGGAAPNNAAWLTGGDLQDPALQQNFAWRSAQFPTPGFVVYNPGSILPGAGMADPLDRWNLSFALVGTPVPEPATILSVMVGLAAIAKRRRKR